MLTESDGLAQIAGGLFGAPVGHRLYAEFVEYLLARGEHGRCRVAYGVDTLKGFRVIAVVVVGRGEICLDLGCIFRVGIKTDEFLKQLRRR